jgi:hypothetical protein
MLPSGSFDALHDVGEACRPRKFLQAWDHPPKRRAAWKEKFLVSGERFFESADAGFAADDEWRHLLGKDDHVTYRHHGYALHFLFFAVKH